MRSRSRLRGTLRTISAVLLVILITGEAEAQDLRLRERLEPGTAATVIALMDSARTLELPTEPLVQKALEGESKGATGDAIVRAVRSLIHDLVTARKALGGEIGEGELLAAATVLHVGGTPGQLERLRLHRSHAALSAGLTGLAYLISRGVPAEQSTDLIVAMLNARLPGRAFATLQELVETDVRAGAPVTTAATAHVNALIRMGPSDRTSGGRRP